MNNVYLNGVRVAAVLPSGRAFYYLTDQVDSVKLVVSDDGLPVSRMEYLPFGDTWFQEGDLSHNPKYNSQELDKETGYYFYNARHYDAGIGRFVTPDTVIPDEGFTQSWNRYTYCRNNPIIYTDPTGHKDYNTQEDYAIRDQIVNSYKLDEKTGIGTAEVKRGDETIKLIFNKSDANNNSIDIIKKSSPRLWTNVVDAAVKSDVSAIKINAVGRKDDKGAHGMGVALDLQSITSKDGKEYAFKRTHDESTGGWSNPEEPKVIKDFTKVFMKGEGSTYAYQPWEMNYYYKKDPMKNIIDEYPSLSKISPINVKGEGGKYIPSEKFENYIRANDIDKDKAEHLFWDAEHSHHGHFQVGAKYRID